MIVLDTNVLVQFTKDSEQQLQKVIKLFYELEKKNKKAFVPLLVLHL